MQSIRPAARRCRPVSPARMNAVVVVALKRPYTFVVLSIMILLFGGLAVFRTPTDVFPNIGIPVVSVIWTYTGLTPRGHVRAASCTTTSAR